jgi:hypothetical protein
LRRYFVFYPIRVVEALGERVAEAYNDSRYAVQRRGVWCMVAARKGK